MKEIKLIFILTIFMVYVKASSGQNILISDTGYPNEPSIMMDPKNPQVLVAGSNLNFYYTSNDGGLTWVQNSLSSSYGVWGDPVIDIDTLGNFYFFHLSNPSDGNWIDRIVCQKSTNNGVSWTDGTYTGLNGHKVQDKQWSVIDRKNNNIYLTWTQFDSYKSTTPGDSSVILFSKSIDGGISWSSPKRINKTAGDCIDSNGTVEGAVPAIGPNGEIYVAWAGPKGIVFNKSSDQGDTWLNEEILIDPMPGGWDFQISGIMRANGLPVTKCDLSGGKNHGTIYVNWSDQRNGIYDTDIWLSKSTDGGNTWSAPSRVNNDVSGRHQFFTWMDIDQTNGNLFFVFYDRRNYSGNQTDVYLAISKDGGVTFENRKISESLFVPREDIFFGDYTNIVAHNNIVRPIWTRLNSGTLSIWTDVTPLNEILTSTNDFEDDNEDIVQYPNPASSISYISFKLHKLSMIRLELYDKQGKLVHTMIDNNKLDYGKHVIPIDLDVLNIPEGIYYYRLTIDKTSSALRSVILK